MPEEPQNQTADAAEESLSSRDKLARAMGFNPAKRKIDNTPTPRRTASAMVIALFGALAILNLTWSAWCMEWLGTEVAGEILVVVTMTLVAGYAVQLVRYVRTAVPEKLSNLGRILGCAYWALIALFVMKVVWKEHGYLAGLFGTLVIMDAGFLFANILNIRKLPRLYALCAANYLTHAIGWFLLLGSFIYGMLAFLSPITSGALRLSTAGMPAFMAIPLEAVVNTAGLPLTALLGILLTALSVCLRVMLLSKSSGTPFRSLFNLGTKYSLGIFIASAIFCTAIHMVLVGRQADAIASWQDFSGDAHYEPSQEEKNFNLRQKDIGILVLSISNELPSTDAPYSWQEFISQANGDDLPRWFPKGIAPDEEDLVSLKAYRDALSPALASLDALLEAIPDAGEGRIAKGIFELQEWRFVAASVCEEWDEAWHCMEAYRMLCVHELESDDFGQRLNGANKLRRWLQMAMRVPDGYLKVFLDKVKETITRIEGLKDKAAMARLVDEYHAHLQMCSASMFRKMRFCMPYLDMLAAADDTSLLKLFTGVDDHALLKDVNQPFGLYSRLALFNVNNSYNKTLDTTLGRLEQIAQVGTAREMTERAEQPQP